MSGIAVTPWRARAVCFDVDGTLYPTGGRVLWRALWTPGALRALRLLKAVREPLRGHTFDTGELLRATVAQQLAARAQLDVAGAHALMQRVTTTVWRAVLRGAAPASTRATLTQLRTAGFRLAALSDHDTAQKMEALGLLDAVDVLVSAEDTGAYKPNPRGFEAVAKALGVTPADVVHVGDRADADVAGAHAAGMRAILVGQHPPDASTVGVRQLRDVPALLLRSED